MDNSILFSKKKISFFQLNAYLNTLFLVIFTFKINYIKKLHFGLNFILVPRNIDLCQWRVLDYKVLQKCPSKYKICSN